MCGLQGVAPAIARWNWILAVWILVDFGLTRGCEVCVSFWVGSSLDVSLSFQSTNGGWAAFPVPNKLVTGVLSSGIDARSLDLRPTTGFESLASSNTVANLPADWVSWKLAIEVRATGFESGWGVLCL